MKKVIIACLLLLGLIIGIIIIINLYTAGVLPLLIALACIGLLIVAVFISWVKLAVKK